jgi:hypothetical protein
MKIFLYGCEIVVFGLLLICGVSSHWEIVKEGPVDGVCSGARGPLVRGQ